MIKLVATDIDGTIVEDGTLNLNPEYIDVLDKLTERGITVVICSGRQFTSEKKLFAPIKDKLYFISDGGAVIRHAEEILKVYRFDPVIWKEMYREAKKLKECDVMACLPDYCIAESDETPMYHWITESYGFDVHCMSPLDQISDDVIKFSVYHKDSCEEKCAADFTPKFEQLVDLSVAGKQWVDCIPKGVNKGSSLRYLQERLHIRPEECMTFGDNLNDITMIRAAGYGYAVSNAREEVRSAAYGTVPPYWEMGVLEKLKTLL